MVDAPIFEPGQRCGVYVIHQRVGKGVPETYVATHEATRQPIFLQCADARRPGARVLPEPQFFKLVEAIRAFEHPYVATMIDSGVHGGGVYWTASTHSLGRPLVARAPSGARLTSGEIFSAGYLIANAMTLAGRGGLLHGNLSPRCVLITDAYEGADATLKVLGVGSAQLFGAPPDVARKTPLYRAPEQLNGEVIDARADIYSLGMILYGLFAGRAPYFSADGSPPRDMLALVMREEPTPLVDAMGYPEALSDLISTAIQKDREERFPDWMHFGAAVRMTVGQLRADKGARTDGEVRNAARVREDAAGAELAAHPRATEGVDSGLRPRSPESGVPSDDAERAPEAPETQVEPLAVGSAPTTQRSAPPLPVETKGAVLGGSPLARSARPSPRWLRAGAALGGLLGAGLIVASARRPPSIALVSGLGVVDVALAALSRSALADEHDRVASASISPVRAHLPDAPQGAAEDASKRTQRARVVEPPLAPREPAETFSLEDWEPRRPPLARATSGPRR